MLVVENGTHGAASTQPGMQLRQELADRDKQVAALRAELMAERRWRELMTQPVARTDPELTIAAAVHELTGFGVAVEDQFGGLRAWSGPGRPPAYPKPVAEERHRFLAEARRHTAPFRARDGRLVSVAADRGEVLGVLCLHDPHRLADDATAQVLAWASAALRVSLAHQRQLAEQCMQLRRDLVGELIEGHPIDESHLERVRALNHDLEQPHRVMAVSWDGTRTATSLSNSVDRAAQRLEMASLTAARRGPLVVLIAQCPTAWRSLRGWARDPQRSMSGSELPWHTIYSAMRRELGGRGALGVGGPAFEPNQLARSYREAKVALTIQQRIRDSAGILCFDDLGVYRMLARREVAEETRQLVHDWLRPLIEYDAENHTELTLTLARHLQAGRNYDATAARLHIHRSTLRYRLSRIRDLTGYNLADPSTRFNLEFAAGAWILSKGQ